MLSHLGMIGHPEDHTVVEVTTDTNKVTQVTTEVTIVTKKVTGDPWTSKE